MIIENFDIVKPRMIKKEFLEEKEVIRETVKKETKRNLNNERIFESRRKAKQNPKENINTYIVVSIIFILGFLIGVICFEHGINDSNIKEEILNYDFFYNNVEEKSIIVADMMYKNIGLILLYWVVGISVIGAPLLLFVCLYKGMSLAIILSSVLLKYGVKSGYMLLIKNVFLQHFLTDFVIVFLTVSSVKVMYRILFQKQELKNELIRHSIASVMGLLMLFTTIGINCITILNNFT